jgi:Protein kinase domain
MVKDRKAVASNAHEQYFALKVQKSAEHYTEAAMDEVELLDCIHKERKKSRLALEKGSGKDNDGVTADSIVEYSQYVATLHDSFFHTGPNGRHMCMVFSMLGNNLLSVIKAFNYRGIPIPVVKNMIRGICKGLDFLHRKCQIIHTDLKPENVLLHFDGSEDSMTTALGNLSLGNVEGPSQSIEELEGLLAKDNLTPDERKKLKRKLKKKRQKERKKTTDGDDDEDDEDDDDSGDDDDDDEATSSFLSDSSLSQILSTTSGIVESRSIDSDILPPTKRRLQQSAFVTTNFGHREEIADAKLMKLLRSSVTVSEPSSSDIAVDLKIAEKNGGVAEVAFMLRSFTPEEELADAISVAFAGVPWEYDPRDNGSRQW